MRGDQPAEAAGVATTQWGEATGAGPAVGQLAGSFGLGTWPTVAATDPVAEPAENPDQPCGGVAQVPEPPPSLEPEPAGEPQDRDPWSPANVAARDHRELLAEVAGLIADGLDPDDAAELVGVDIQGAKLPGRFAFTPSPATIAAGCLDFQTTWSKNERRKRCMRPAMRWELVEASAAPIASERRACDGLLR